MFKDICRTQQKTKTKNLKRIIKYFSSPINLQNGRQQIYLLEIADFSHGIEFIFIENNVGISKER